MCSACLGLLFDTHFCMLNILKLLFKIYFTQFDKRNFIFLFSSVPVLGWQDTATSFTSTGFKLCPWEGIEWVDWHRDTSWKIWSSLVLPSDSKILNRSNTFYGARFIFSLINLKKLSVNANPLSPSTLSLTQCKYRPQVICWTKTINSNYCEYWTFILLVKQVLLGVNEHFTNYKSFGIVVRKFMLFLEKFVWSVLETGS